MLRVDFPQPVCPHTIVTGWFSTRYNREVPPVRTQRRKGEYDGGILGEVRVDVLVRDLRICCIAIQILQSHFLLYGPQKILDLSTSQWTGCVDVKL